MTAIHTVHRLRRPDMTVYTCVTTFDRLRFEADLAQAAAPIHTVDPETGERYATPYRTADARHSPREAARLVLRWLGREYWLDPTVELGHDAEGRETYAGLAEEAYLDSLIVSVAPAAYTYRALGGTTFEIEDDGTTVGLVEAGEIDDGQWIGDDDDILEAAHDAGILPADVTAITEIG